MLLSNLLNTSIPFGERILTVLLCIIALLPALTFHEWAHGFTAYKLGDRTAKADGRLSLNPLDHIDPIGTLLLLVVGFGWAKPVPVNTRSLKKPKRDLALISLAGPMMNFLLALVSAFIAVLVFYIADANGLCEAKISGLVAYIDIANPTVKAIHSIFTYSMMYNIGLGIFNLFPLPPLDGSNILMGLLPQRLAVKYAQIRHYSSFILIGFILLTRLPYPLNLVGKIITWPISMLTNGFLDLANWAISPFFENFINF